MPYYKIESKESFENIVGNTRIGVLKLSASWCRPCQMIAPEYESLKDTYKEVALMSVDIEEVEFFKDKAYSLPTFHFFVDNKFQDEYTIKGADVNAVRTVLNKLIEVTKKTTSVVSI